MKLLSIPPKNLLMLAALGLAGYWFVTRKATAATTTAKTPAGHVPGTYYMPQPTNNANPLNAVASIFNSLFGSSSGSNGTTSGGEGGDGASSAGEAQAQAYFNDNRDLFAANPPALYQLQNTDTWMGTGLDSK